MLLTYHTLGRTDQLTTTICINRMHGIWHPISGICKDTMSGIRKDKMHHTRSSHSDSAVDALYFGFGRGDRSCFGFRVSNRPRTTRFCGFQGCNLSLNNLTMYGYEASSNTSTSHIGLDFCCCNTQMSKPIHSAIDLCNNCSSNREVLSFGVFPPCNDRWLVSLIEH